MSKIAKKQNLSPRTEDKPSSDPRVICLLGMHRSGTSMIMRLLNICGLYIGEDNELVPAGKGNETGHWENKTVHDINNEILKRFGGTSTEPPHLPDGWENDEKLDDLKKLAIRWVEYMNSKSKIWGFKGPRTCLTIAFWKKIIPNMIYIIPIRNSYDVANSLYKRDSMDLYKGTLLWIRYWISIILGTEGENKLLCPYNEFFIDWKKELDKVLSFIGDKKLNYIGKEDIIKGFIRPDLRHSNEQRKNEIENAIDNNDNNKLLKYFMREIAYNINNIINAQSFGSQLFVKEIEEKKFIIKEKEKYIKDILNSTSWQITAPLRSLIDKIKGIE